MNTHSLEKLLLKTAFSCMACDGHIDPKEVVLIRHLNEEHNIFGDLNLEEEVNLLQDQINQQGEGFLRAYLREVQSTSLTSEEEKAIVSVAVRIIRADDKVEYSEIRFFKLLRSYLKISNKDILRDMPDIEEFLEYDIISPAYVQRLTSAFFENQSIIQISKISFGELGGNIES